VLLRWGIYDGDVVWVNPERPYALGKVVLALASDEERRLEQYFRKDNGTERIAKLREEMQRTMEGGQLFRR